MREGNAKEQGLLSPALTARTREEEVPTNGLEGAPGEEAPSDSVDSSASMTLGSGALDGFKIEISKRFAFEASHHLNGLPERHKCGRDHGHSYRVEVRLTATELSGPGFVTDFGALEPFATYIKERFDHRDLNEVLEVEPTSELLALHLARWFIEHVEPTIPGRLVAVVVSETEKTSATCTVSER
ncbi:6-pyruvoyl trahydropterin synthase family protein [Streptosporangium canum]|uniref:6-pyruvoyl trahydropterin synthase family protein n=1 Tax=Streptosporangium canum TaxID=324952 RepID=UPI0037AA8A2B